jgi:hypothetical protein
MYLSAEAVLKSISILREQVHPFIGITFVACKAFGLPVGHEIEVSIDMLTRAHMDKHHRIDRRSAFFFQPFKGGARWWIDKKYPSSGLQTINTQTFPSVFLHARNSKTWGFQTDYIASIKRVLSERNFSDVIPADALAVWLFKDIDLGQISDFEHLVQKFFECYNISTEEQKTLFGSRAMLQELPLGVVFSESLPEMTAILRELQSPPDAAAEGGRTITSMRLINAGPAREMSINFGQRLSIVTGDNGLGKSFLLDFAWWAATGMWADREALPQFEGLKTPPEVVYGLSGNSGRLATFKSTFDQSAMVWSRPKSAMTVEAIAVFSRADGSFAIADPVRTRFNKGVGVAGSLKPSDVWNGKQPVIEGLIRDWVRWQNSSDSKTFDQFTTILKRLSPEDLGTLAPGENVRLPGDPREIPTIQHRYGSVPVTHASSGVQRVLLLAYLIIWSWQEHEVAAKGIGISPLRRMLVIVDELEAHLHPKWQRIVLPALLNTGDILSSDIAIQMIAATHSPMILASMEGNFDASTDRLYHLFGSGPDVHLEETQFVQYGDASGWLTSPLFGLRHARSREAEMAIEDAKAVQLSDSPDPAKVAEISSRLRQYLANDDRFWPRWLYFAEKQGVQI